MNFLLRNLRNLTTVPSLYLHFHPLKKTPYMLLFSTSPTTLFPAKRTLNEHDRRSDENDQRPILDYDFTYTIDKEDYENAVRLQAILFKLYFIMKEDCEERYEDATFLRNNTGAGLMSKVGWYAGVSGNHMYPHSQIIHIPAEHERLLAKSHSSWQLATAKDETAHFEIYGSTSTEGIYNEQATIHYAFAVGENSAEQKAIVHHAFAVAGIVQKATRKLDDDFLFLPALERKVCLPISLNVDENNDQQRSRHKSGPFVLSQARNQQPLLSGITTFKQIEVPAAPLNGSPSAESSVISYRRISAIYEMWVASKFKDPLATRVRPSYEGDIVTERLVNSIAPPEKDRRLALRIQVASSRSKSNIHFLGTCEVNEQEVRGKLRGGRNENKPRYKENRVVTKLVSINAKAPAEMAIHSVAGIITSLPFYQALEDIWQSDDGEHANFIAREYLKHSSWSDFERISILDYCHVALLLGEQLASGKYNFQELLPLLKFFKGNFYKCMHLEYKVTCTLKVKVKGYYLTFEDDCMKTEMVKLDELVVVSSTKGALVDNPEEYTPGLFLL